MSTSRKILKVLSILFCIGGVAEIALGALGFAAGDSVTGSAVDTSFFGACMIAFGVVDIFAGVCGIRAANNPVKAGGAFVWGIIRVVCSVIGLGLSLPVLGGVGVGAGTVIALVVDVAFFVLACVAKKEGKERLQ